MLGASTITTRPAAEADTRTAAGFRTVDWLLKSSQRTTHHALVDVKDSSGTKHHTGIFLVLERWCWTPKHENYETALRLRRRWQYRTSGATDRAEDPMRVSTSVSTGVRQDRERRRLRLLLVQHRVNSGRPQPTDGGNQAHQSNLL